VSGYKDEKVAERHARMAEGTTAQIGEATELDEYPKGLVMGTDHIDALMARLAAYNAGLQETMALADKLDDVNTVTLLSDISLAVEKMAWMISAHAAVS
jgi:DNA-binding ferritin-like protein